MSDNQDIHAGKGGSYVATDDGQRVLQERTGEVIKAEPVAAPKTDKSKVKGASNAKPN